MLVSLSATEGARVTALDEQTPLQQIRNELEHVCQQLDAKIKADAETRPPEPSPSYNTIDETAAYLKSSPASVRRWIRSGRLRAVKLAGNRVYRVRPDWIQDFLDR